VDDWMLVAVNARRHEFIRNAEVDQLIREARAVRPSPSRRLRAAVGRRLSAWGEKLQRGAMVSPLEWEKAPCG
jgi:hypothetical protein